jgi:hypothetical protein
MMALLVNMAVLLAGCGFGGTGVRQWEARGWACRSALYEQNGMMAL